MARKSVTGAQIIADARRYLGVPYVFGGTNPKTGLDCSGLVLVVCNDLGITSCPRTSEEQFQWVTPIQQPETGALVFFTGDPIDPPPGHVGFVVAPGKFLNAPHTGTVVQIDSFTTNGTGSNKFMGYGRIPTTSPSPGQAGANPFTDPGEIKDATLSFGGAIAAGVMIVLVAVLAGAALLALIGAGVIFS